MRNASPISTDVQKFLYTRNEAAFSLGVSVRSIDYFVAQKKLATRKIGGRVLIPVSELRRFAHADHFDRISPEPKNVAA